MEKYYKLWDENNKDILVIENGDAAFQVGFDLNGEMTKKKFNMIPYYLYETEVYDFFDEISETDFKSELEKQKTRLLELKIVAEELAEEYHEGQFDKGGKPYIEHIKRVSARMSDLDCYIIANLHDLIEDTTVTSEYLKDCGFFERHIKAVECLTHNEEHDYERYIQQVGLNEFARIVKLADLRDNLDPNRFHKGYKENREKYEKAYAFLY